MTPRTDSSAPPEKILVRATIAMPGLAHDQEALVDPAIPYIAEALEAGYLEPVRQT